MTVKSSIFFGVFPVFLFALCRVATADTGPLGFGDALFDQEMETDRPDFTEGTQAVQSGHFQLELGYSFVRDSDSDTEEHAAPESLLRIGLMSDLELRLAWDGYRNLEVDDSTTDGVGDMSVGFKYRFTDQTDSLPALGLIVELAVPSGSSEFTQDDVAPAVKFLWARDLDSTWGLAGNLNFATPVEEDDRYFETSVSLALGAAINEEWGTYVEAYSIFPNSDAPSATDTHFINGGFTYAVTDSVQLDILAGFGINDNADDFFTGLGVSFRV